ncbi:MAG: hypothetical protein ACYCX6_08820 [Vulcanimicrobiaceae bacterium]
MNGKRYKWRRGDILQVSLPAEFRYLQHVDKWPNGGDLLRIVDIRSTTPVTDVREIGRHVSLYWMLSFCKVLIEDSRFTYVGNDDSAGEIPPLRRPHFGGWFIIRGDQETFTKNLDEETLRMSLERWEPADGIVERLLSGWRPQDDRKDALAILRGGARKNRSDGARGLTQTTYFIDFPTPLNAAKAARDLKKQGIEVSVKQKKELHVKKKTADSLDISKTLDVFESELNAFCSAYGGEVTGRETELHPDPNW